MSVRPALSARNVASSGLPVGYPPVELSLVMTLPCAFGGSYSDGNETLTISPTFRRIVAPESDSTRVRDPVYVGVGEGVTLFVGNGVTVAAGLADAVPTLAMTDGVAVVEGGPPAVVEAAQPQSTQRTTRSMRLISMRRYAAHHRSGP